MEQHSRRSRLFSVPVLVTLCLGISVSAFLFFLGKKLERGGLENQFKLEASERVDLLTDTIDAHLNVLLAVSSFYGASQLVERDEFRDFVNNFLEKFPSILALQWAPKVTASGRARFVQNAEREGFVNFKIWDEIGEEGRIPAGKQSEYFPVYFTEPFKETSGQIGFDLSSGPREQALKMAGDSGNMTATTQLNSAAQFHGANQILVYMPIYAHGPRQESLVWRRANLEGMVVGIYEAENIFTRSLSFLRPEEMDIYVFDESEEPERALLYRHTASGDRNGDIKNIHAVQNKAVFHYERVIAVGGRKWRLVCIPSEKFFAVSRTYLPYLFLFVGLFFTGIMARYLYSHWHRTRVIEELVARRTSELVAAKESLEREVGEHRQTESRLIDINEKWRSLVENAPDIIILIDFEGTIQFINRTTQGLTVEGVLNRKIFEFMPEEYHEIVNKVFSHVRETGENKTFDVPSKVPGQEPRWFRSRVGPVKSDKKTTALIIITADITEQKTVEENLEQTKDFLDKIINSVADPIFVKDREHRFVLLNDMLCDMMGHTRDELIGKSDYDFFPKNQVDVFTEKDELVFKTGKTNVNEEDFTDKDGVVRAISTKKSLYVDPAGREFIVGVIRDVSEAKRTEKILVESQRLYADLFENAPDPIVRFSPLGNFVTVNPAAEKVFGKTKKDLIGVHFSKAGIFSAASKSKMLNEFQLIMLGDKRPPTELEIMNHEGESRIYEANPRVIHKKGEVEGLQVIFRDITERKRREEVEIKSRFVSTVSHELRTPLQSIREGISVILDRAAGDINERQEDFLKIVKRNVERLSRLIDNVLDFQKIDTLKDNLQMESCSINELLREVEKMMTTLVENEGLRLEMKLAESVPKIKMDYDKIMQVLINLMDNAVKFTKKGKIQIASEKTDEAIKVSVTDTGAGIKKENIPGLFQAFAQVKTASGKSPGTGLGLAISRQIIEQHGGKIHVESQFGKGSTFWFELPRAP